MTAVCGGCRWWVEVSTTGAMKTLTFGWVLAFPISNSVVNDNKLINQYNSYFMYSGSVIKTYIVRSIWSKIEWLYTYILWAIPRTVLAATARRAVTRWSVQRCADLPSERWPGRARSAAACRWSSSVSRTQHHSVVKPQHSLPHKSYDESAVRTYSYEKYYSCCTRGSKA